MISALFMKDALKSQEGPASTFKRRGAAVPSAPPILGPGATSGNWFLVSAFKYPACWAGGRGAGLSPS